LKQGLNLLWFRHTNYLSQEPEVQYQSVLMDIIDTYILIDQLYL